MVPDSSQQGIGAVATGFSGVNINNQVPNPFNTTNNTNNNINPIQQQQQ
jgi:hypothetical protein